MYFFSYKIFKPWELRWPMKFHLPLGMKIWEFPRSKGLVDSIVCLLILITNTVLYTMRYRSA